MDIVEKLGNSLRGFKQPGDIDSCSPAQLMAIGEHNLAEYERLASENPDTLLHINGLITRVMAKIQPAVIEKYGAITGDTMRQYLTQAFKEKETETKAWLELAEKAIGDLALNGEQTQAVNLVLQMLPYLMIEKFMQIIGKSYLIPEEYSSQIVNALVEMAKEAGDADSAGNN